MPMTFVIGTSLLHASDWESLSRYVAPLTKVWSIGT